MTRNLNFLSDLSQLIDLVNKENNVSFKMGNISESGDIDIVNNNMKYDFDFNMKLLNFICDNLPDNIKYAYLTCGNDKNIINDIKNNKITERNYTKFENKLIKKFKDRSKVRQIYYQSKYSLLRWSYNDIQTKKNKIKDVFKKESTFILNLVGINSNIDFMPLQFVIYSINEKTFYSKCDRDDNLDFLLWKYFAPKYNFNFSYYAEIRIHYLKFFKSESHENWLLNEIKNNLFDFNIPKSITYDVLENIIYLIEKYRKKKYYADAITRQSTYDFNYVFSKNNMITKYFNNGNDEIRYFYFFKMYLMDLLGFNLSNKRLAITFKKHLLKSKILPFKLRNLSNKEIIYLVKISENPYFLTYFNNLTWQTLPLPWVEIGNKLLATYGRKKGLLSFINDKYSIGGEKERTYFKNYQVKNENELLTNLNIDNFNPKLFPKDCDFIIGTKDNFYLCNKLVLIFEYPFNYKVISGKCKFKKKYPEKLNVPCENTKSWNVFTKDIKIKLDDIIYISVMKKLVKEDLYDVFLQDSLENNLKLYHNTQVKGNKSYYENLLNNATFFAFSNKYDSKYFVDGTKCITYVTNNKISDLLLLGLNVSKINIFNKVPEEVKGKSVIFNKNDKFYKFIDIGTNKQYEGRRKLQELVFGTRQFVPSEIYNCESWGQKTEDINHPKNKRTAMSYDAVYLSQIGINGFIADDFKFALDTEGELLLTHPNKYVKIININDYKCSLLNT